MSHTDQIGELLRKNGFRKTAIRSEIIELFLSHNHALSSAYILEQLKSGNDRVTVYRALESFVSKGIIHKVADIEGHAPKFALCSHECNSDAHEDDHVHFVCKECKQTFCLEEVHIPKVNLPDGYLKDHSNFTIHGVCENCSQ